MVFFLGRQDQTRRLLSATGETPAPHGTAADVPYRTAAAVPYRAAAAAAVAAVVCNRWRPEFL